MAAITRAPLSIIGAKEQRNRDRLVPLVALTYHDFLRVLVFTLQSSKSGTYKDILGGVSHRGLRHDAIELGRCYGTIARTFQQIHPYDLRKQPCQQP